MKFVEEIKKGAVFIYPTDTIYGIGCDATNSEAVKRVKKLKGRDENKPLSVIAPSVDWIKENCEIDEEMIDKYLPGPYTLILRKKDKSFLKEVCNSETIGVRIPDCNFAKIIKEAGVPFVTTSVNLSGKPFAIMISDIDKKILDAVDFIIGIGELNGRPSTLIIDGKEVKR